MLYPLISRLGFGKMPSVWYSPAYIFTVFFVVLDMPIHIYESMKDDCLFNFTSLRKLGSEFSYKKNDLGSFVTAPKLASF